MYFIHRKYAKIQLKNFPRRQALIITNGGDKKLVSKGILFTTVLSVITIPILT